MSRPAPPSAVRVRIDELAVGDGVARGVDVVAVGDAPDALAGAAAQSLGDGVGADERDEAVDTSSTTAEVRRTHADAASRPRAP